MPTPVLSKRKRNTYLALCIVAFFIIAPLVASYATGYRFGKRFEVAKTGGIYIVIEGKGFSISLDEKQQEVSSIFRRNFFIQNLEPKRYFLTVAKEGYHSWSKTIDVQSEKVADVYPFNLPHDVALVEIPRTIQTLSEVDASTSKNISLPNEEYVTVKSLFATTSERYITYKSKSSSTDEVPKHIIFYKKIALWSKGDEIFVKWLGDTEAAPLYFCINTTCNDTLQIFKGLKVNNIDLLSDKQEFVIFSTDNGIYVTEIDSRGGRNIQALLIGSGYDFRIDNNQTLFIKKDKIYYRVDLTL